MGNLISVKFKFNVSDIACTMQMCMCEDSTIFVTDKENKYGMMQQNMEEMHRWPSVVWLSGPDGCTSDDDILQLSRCPVILSYFSQTGF